MRLFPSKSGPFGQQPFFDTEEIESVCVDELRKTDLYPSDPEPIRIDRFIEKRFKVHAAYEDLPRGLLGFTRFGRNGVEAIVVAKCLDDEGTRPAERRLRSTLAHEAGHGLFHASFFELGDRPESLFGHSLAVDEPKILCRDVGRAEVQVTNRKLPCHWWEFQANQAMGALLLPRLLIEKALASLLVANGLLEIPTLPLERRDRAVRILAETFDVNPVVVRIRLDGIYPAGATQLTF